jgi:processive 1,2-diacylglycerol beta-glucosyltransferase
MFACDLLVSKTGAVTLAEAFCCGLPVLAFDPLPGQEEGNARYVVGRGAAELATSPAHLVDLARELRWSPDRRAMLAANGRRLATPTAARDAAEAILARLSGRV